MTDKLSKEKVVILRRPKVEERTGLSRSTLYSKIATGNFPKPIKLSERSVGWLQSEIDAWLEARVRARETEAA